MTPEEVLRKRLARLETWSERFGRIWQKEIDVVDTQFEKAVHDLEAGRAHALESYRQDEARIRGEIDQAGKDFAQRKYQMERDGSVSRAEIERAQKELDEFRRQADKEITRINEERVNIQVSLDRQKSALTDLYNEKRRHLSVTRASLSRDCKTAEEKLRKLKSQYEQNLSSLKDDHAKKISALNEQATGKRAGWSIALETMERNLEAQNAEKDHLEKQLTLIREEKEKELEAARVAMTVAREQLEIDKATLVEKAEEDQRRCEAEVQSLRERIEVSERELQDLVVSKEKQIKSSEEVFQKEEEALKEAVRLEAEKRDYEQKLFEQEKTQKEKELNRLREEYEKKKWHWDNQIRTLLMQKSVQDSEFESERMRVDREARVVLRGLEAKRDEMRQRLADIKSRHENLTVNTKKEEELLHQRWNWRKERLWSVWKTRLDTLKKERLALEEQIDHLEQTFAKEKTAVEGSEKQEAKRLDDLQQFVFQMAEGNRGHRKQREIQLELEKTRIIAQIKESETLLEEWMGRLKISQDAVAKKNAGFVEQMSALDQWYREEEKETGLFLHSLERALTTLEGLLARAGLNKAA